MNNNRYFQHVAVLLALAAPLAAVCGYAQQNNGSPDGLYTVPDADVAARNKQESPSNRSAESFTESLDPEALRSKADTDRAEAVRAGVLARKSAHGVVANQGPSWSDSIDITEWGWIAILTSVGLVISLAAGGYVWWNRAQSKQSSVAILMPMKSRPSGKAATASTADKKKDTKRRAA